MKFIQKTLGKVHIRKTGECETLRILLLFIFQLCVINSNSQREESVRIGPLFKYGFLEIQNTSEFNDYSLTPTYSFGMHLEMPHKIIFFSAEISMMNSQVYCSGGSWQPDEYYFNGSVHESKGYSFYYAEKFQRICGLGKINALIGSVKRRVHFIVGIGGGIEITSSFNALKDSYSSWNYIQSQGYNNNGEYVYSYTDIEPPGSYNIYFHPSTES